jgi:MFS superfamily sulfate permease-like transporter
MSKTNKHVVPATGWQGFVRHWRNDLIAAFSVSLVALPLALGIAVASGLPPISGILTAVIGGLVTTIFRGSYIGINGPAAGLIAVVYTAVMSLKDGTGKELNYLMAAILICGAIQVILGLFKLGKIAEIYPSSVIHGVLAAIGVIIFSKQIHVALGSDSTADTTIGVLMDIPNSMIHLNPFVTIISVVSIVLLVFHSRISYKLFHFLPAPIWVLVISIPFVYGFDFFELHQLNFLGKDYEVGPGFLISLPENLMDSFIFPDFSRIGDGVFWLAVLSITLIASIETLAISKAVDKLDPYNRITNPNKELVGLGISNMVSGLLGGLPIITVIVRSSVNVNNNAKTSWSNVYHGLFLVLFIVLLGPVISQVPLAALAAILVFTGYKLAAPWVFKQAYHQGIEQLLFLVGTLIITLYTDLLWGIFGGILLTLIVHLLLARLPVVDFFQMIFKSGTSLEEKKPGFYILNVKGIANFLSMLFLKDMIEKVPQEAHLSVRFTEARLVDFTVQEYIKEFGRRYQENGGYFVMEGFEYHVASTNHPLALKSRFTKPKIRLKPRQLQLKELAQKHDWVYQPEVDWNTSYLQNFQFFETRPIERKTNSIVGSYANTNIYWEMADITFDEGALVATEVYHTTVQIIRLPFDLPQFVLEKEGYFDKIFDRVMAFSGQKDIDFELFTHFSKKFLLKGEDEATIRQLFTPELIHFFENEDIYHVECNGEALLIFQYLRLAKTEEATKMVDFSEVLLSKLK